jgi:D-glycero-D-manno-heptose 1,7-bisphosphate phosphatase
MIARHHLDPMQCIMVGDRESDIEAGLNARIQTVAVCTGRLDADAWRARAYPGVSVYPTFAAFAQGLKQA